MLTPRQARLYKYTVALYGVDPAWNPSMGDPIPSAVVSASQVCYFEARPEFDEPSATGLTPGISSFEIDAFHFPLGVAIQNDMAIKMLAAPEANSNLVGLWWMCLGGVDTHAYLANKLIVRAKRTSTPGWAP